MNIKKIIAREGLIILSIVIISIFVGAGVYRHFWGKVPPNITDFSLFENHSYGAYVRSWLGLMFAIYGFYWLIRFILWATKTLKDKDKKKKLYKWVNDYLDPRRLLITIAVVSIPAMLLYSKTNDKNSSILLATLVAIIIYTWKNWQLKDLTADQITLQIRPLIIFECSGRRMKNVGKGIAQHIWIDSIPIEYFKEWLDIGLTKAKFVTFNKVGCLEDEGVTDTLNFQLLDSDKKVVTETNVHNQISDVFDNHARSLRELKMDIRYYDLRGHAYKTHMENKDGVLQVTKLKSLIIR